MPQGKPVALDALDRKILVELQRDATPSLDDLASRVGSSKTPVWNRIRKLREAGVIDRQVAVLDPEAVGLGACFFVLIRTSQHEPSRPTGWPARSTTSCRCASRTPAPMTPSIAA